MGNSAFWVCARLHPSFGGGGGGGGCCSILFCPRLLMADVFFAKRSTVYGNGVQYLSDLLDVIRNSSPDNATALNKLQSGRGKTSASPCSPDGDTEDAEARARR